MAKFTMHFVRGVEQLGVEFDGMDEMDALLPKLASRGWVAWGITPSTITYTEKEVKELVSAVQPDLGGEVKFCPIHGESKKWEDRKDGGFYCGNKVNGKWCGYAETDEGVMRKPPKSMPDYVQF